MKVIMKTSIKGLVLITIAASAAAFAGTSTELEPVFTISADDATMLLSDDIMLVSHEAAAELLGDHSDNMALSIDSINSMPATAAGTTDILYIDADAAAQLLGDETH